MLVAMRQLLPSRFPASLSMSEEGLVVGKHAQEEQFVHSSLLAQMQRLINQQAGIMRALATPQALAAFWNFLDDNEKQQLQTLGFSPDELNAQHDAVSTLERMPKLSPAVATAIHRLERRPFEAFLQTSAGEVVLGGLVPSPRLSKGEEANAFFSGYTIPTDAAGWLRAFAVLSASMQSQVCLSDMMLPGNPLIYVNHAWCKTTGYSREEVLGRNCRLLQGQDTQPAAVQEMVDALRAGVDACVCITNYRKDGEKFDNLVVLRPVLDSNGVYRFCIGLSLAVQGSVAPKMPVSVPRLKHAAAELASLRNVIRSWVPWPIGKVHKESSVTEHMLHHSKCTEAQSLLTEALNKHFLLHVLDDDCKMALVAAFEPLSVLAGQYLIKRGSPPETIYVLSDGSCSVTHGQTSVKDLQAGDVFGELSIIQGTVASASIVTNTACELHVLKKTVYTHILAKHGAQAGLLPSAEACMYLANQEPLNQRERAICELMQQTVVSRDRKQSPGRSGASASFATNHNDMLEALRALPAQQQLSVLYWLNTPGRSLLAVMQHETAQASFDMFLQAHDSAAAAHQLALVLQAQTPSSGSLSPAAILSNLEPGIDVETLSDLEVDERLQSVVSTTLEDHARRLLPEFLCSNVFFGLLKQFSARPSLSRGLPALSAQATWLSMFTNATSKLVHAVLVVDVRVAGLPLVYVNDAFERLTGYTPVEAVGQNCRFLQGDATEAEAVAELAHAIRERRSCVVKITNYHKSGTAFANELSLHPVCDFAVCTIT